MSLNPAISPSISVIMPVRNGERYIDAAITSVRRQSLSSLELIVIDDASTDGTAQRVQAHADQDARIRLIAGLGCGPGAARNLGLSMALGHWIAVVDADDEILPDRLSRLVDAASDDAHMVADNLTAFYDDGRAQHDWLQGGAWAHDHVISLEAFLMAGIGGTDTDHPGYLKPLFDRLWLAEHGLYYDESLTIGEDYDLVARVLAAGGIFRFMSEAGYRYRRHTASTSHRITTEQLDAMLAAFERLKSQIGPRERRALERRMDSLVQDQRFIGVVDDLKARSPAALWKAVADPRLRGRLLRATRDGLARRLSGR